MPLTATSPLVKHWLREALERFAEIDMICCHDLTYDAGAPLGARNLWIAEHGAALRLGGVPWGDQMMQPVRRSTLERRYAAGSFDAALLPSRERDGSSFAASSGSPWGEVPEGLFSGGG